MCSSDLRPLPARPAHFASHVPDHGTDARVAPETPVKKIQDQLPSRRGHDPTTVPIQRPLTPLQALRLGSSPPEGGAIPCLGPIQSHHREAEKRQVFALHTDHLTIGSQGAGSSPQRGAIPCPKQAWAEAKCLVMPSSS